LSDGICHICVMLVMVVHFRDFKVRRISYEGSNFGAQTMAMLSGNMIW
jgi:hypothetical protein